MQSISPIFSDQEPASEILDVPFGAYEAYQLRSFAHAVLGAERGRTRVTLSADFVEWYRQNRKRLKISVGGLDTAILRAKNVAFGDIEVRIPQSAASEIRQRPPAKSALQKRIDWVVKTLRLSARDEKVLGAIVRLTQLDQFQQFREAYSGEDRSNDEITARTLLRVCGLRRSDTAMFSNSAPLVQLGLIENRGGGDFAPSKTLLRVLAQRSTSEATLTFALLGKPSTSTLNMADFQHLGTVAQHARDIVDGALRENSAGAGVLFYGAPGTGKTEFARLLANELNAHVVFVGESGSRDVEPSRADRIAHLALLSSLADLIGRVILVIDEADDIFTGIDDQEFSNRAGSKVFMNRVVEACPVPTIWISNFPDRLGQSILRRMLHAVEFREPDQTARRRIIDRLAQAQDMVLTTDERDGLAAIAAPPAVIESGLRASRLAGYNGNLALASSRSVLKAMGRHQPPNPHPSSIVFDARQSSADTDLMVLTQRVQAAGPGALTFLFFGLPGTGKSAYARHLASSLGMDVLEKRGSDLLAMYVGESEKRIAEAFEEAADRKLFLIMDEVDSLLTDRRNAHRSWEVSQVNEMLTRMESHPIPFAATTNNIDRLDPATMRRFLFKVAFQPMSEEQIIAAFRHYFSADAPRDIIRLDPLTPGDFNVVRRKAQILGVNAPSTLCAMLADEVSLKRGNRSRPVGFAAAL